MSWRSHVYWNRMRASGSACDSAVRSKRLQGIQLLNETRERLAFGVRVCV